MSEELTEYCVHWCYQGCENCLCKQQENERNQDEIVRNATPER